MSNPYIGNAPTDIPLSTDQLGNGIVTTAKLASPIAPTPFIAVLLICNQGNVPPIKPNTLATFFPEKREFVETLSLKRPL